MGRYDTPSVKNQSSAGALDAQHSTIQLTGGSAQAMTLPNLDSTFFNGHRLLVISKTAQAHTITYTGGFAGVGAGGDVATFGGAIGDWIEMEYLDGVWYDLGTHNVTLG